MNENRSRETDRPASTDELLELEYERRRRQMDPDLGASFGERPELEHSAHPRPLRK